MIEKREKVKIKFEILFTKSGFWGFGITRYLLFSQGLIFSIKDWGWLLVSCGVDNAFDDYKN